MEYNFFTVLHYFLLYNNIYTPFLSYHYPHIFIQMHSSKKYISKASVQFSHSVTSDSATPWTAAHQASLSITTNSRSLFNSWPLCWWCHLTILSSMDPFSCLQSFPASGSFPMSQFFALGGQRIGASASVLPMNIQDWFPLGWTGWISLQSKGLSRVFSNTKVQKHQLWRSAFFMVQLSHPYMTTGKAIALTRWNFVDKVMSLLFNMPSRFVIAFLPRSKHLFDVHYLKSYIGFLFPSKMQVFLASSKLLHLQNMK